MSVKSSIEWTSATWNPIRGCSRVSQGCVNCYAERIAARFADQHAGPPTLQGDTPDSDTRFARATESGPRWTGRVQLIESKLADPLRWKRRRLVFVNSMSDLFHEKLSDQDIDRVFAVMALSHHTFQVLTKRPERMLRYMRGRDWSDSVNWAHDRYVKRLDGPLHLAGEIVPPLPNVWLGVSAENQATATERIPPLLETPAAVRFVSAEPLLGPVDFMAIKWTADQPMPALRPCIVWSGDRKITYQRPALDWVIVGGESGPHARPMHPAWAQSIRDQCQSSGVAFFFKQWGELVEMAQAPDATVREVDAAVNLSGHPERFFAVGKKRAGRQLDGRTWDQFPVVAS